MGKHRSKRDQAVKLVNDLSSQIQKSENRDAIQSLFRRIQRDSAIDQISRRNHSLPSPGLVVRVLAALKTPESRQLLHVFLNAFFEYDFDSLAETVLRQIERTRVSITRLDRSSSGGRMKLTQMRAALVRRLALANKLLNISTLAQSRQGQIEADQHSTMRVTALIDNAERYLFPDAVSELRNGKGDRSMSIRRSFPVIA